MLTTFVQNPLVILPLLFALAKVGLYVLMGISWVVGWMREPTPDGRAFKLKRALGWLSAVSFRDSPGSSKAPFTPAPGPRHRHSSGRHWPSSSLIPAVLLSLALSHGCAGFLSEQHARVITAASESMTASARRVSDADEARQRHILDLAHGDPAAAKRSLAQYRRERDGILQSLDEGQALLLAAHQALLMPPSDAAGWRALCAPPSSAGALPCPGSVGAYAELLRARAGRLQLQAQQLALKWPSGKPAPGEVESVPHETKPSDGGL